MTQGLFTAMRYRRGYPGMVIANDHQHTAMTASTSSMAMQQGITRTVYPGPLAIPHAKHPIHSFLLMAFQLLGTHQHGCRQVFVNCWLETNLGVIKQCLMPPKRRIYPAQWRTSIPRYKTGRI